MVNAFCQVRDRKTTYCTGQAIITHELKFGSARPLFHEDEDIFQKSATLVVILLQFRLQPTWPIFELHLKKKVFFPVGILSQIGRCR